MLVLSQFPYIDDISLQFFVVWPKGLFLFLCELYVTY